MATESMLRAIVLLLTLGRAVTACQESSEAPPVPRTAIDISPKSAAAGSSDLTVTLNAIGSAFGDAEAYRFQAVWRARDTNTNLATTYVNSTQLTAVVPAALLQDAGVARVNVVMTDRIENFLVNATNAVGFTVTPPPPHMLGAITPTRASAGSSDVTLSLTGSGFKGGHFNRTQAVWRANGSVTDLATTYVSSSQLTAVVPAGLLKNAVVAQVFLLTGDVMGDIPLVQSNAIAFTVAAAPNETVARP